MPRFVTISPTDISGKKTYAWENFLNGNYVALGWYHKDFSNLSLDRIITDIKQENLGKKESLAIAAHATFFRIEVGDIIAVNNVNHFLFGIGKIKSDYKFKKYYHDTGSDNKEEFYSHYREVDWLITDRLKWEDISNTSETPWRPYGTIYSLDALPGYIDRLLEMKGEMIAPSSADWIGDSELIGYEGEIHEELKLHKWVERDKKFVNVYKEKYKNIKNCHGCKMNPEMKFGIKAIEFLELHHITPLALRKSDRNTITKEGEVTLLCPNCHKLIHKMMSNKNNSVVRLEDLKTVAKIE